MAVREWVEEELWRDRGRACLAASANGGDVRKGMKPTECPVLLVSSRVHLWVLVSVLCDFELCVGARTRSLWGVMLTGLRRSTKFEGTPEYSTSRLPAPSLPANALNS